MNFRTGLLWVVLSAMLLGGGHAQAVQSGRAPTRPQPSGAKAAAPTAPAPKSRSVIINGKRLSTEELQIIELRYRTRIADGEYWYDKISGAWGVKGGPTVGFVRPGLNLGGPLRADASNGHTGVFVNGRELHAQDVAALRQIIPVRPGRYWVDGRGIGGYDGGPPLFNLVALAQRAGRPRGGAWSYTSPHGGSVGGDGQGFYYYIDKDSSFTSGR